MYTTKFIVMTSSAKMPQSCWGTYRNVAVLEVEAGASPKMISKRARGVVRIIRHYGPQNVGSTERCAYERTLLDAHALVERYYNARRLAAQ